MKIVAFLQNPWFQPGTADRHIQRYKTDQEFHRRVLAMSMSGRRLMMAFGDLYDEIHWDNTNWRPAWHASGREEPDLTWMGLVINEQNPGMVLTFGSQARDAYLELCRMGSCWQRHLMICHHPNARHKTQADLNRFAEYVKIAIMGYATR